MMTDQKTLLPHVSLMANQKGVALLMVLWIVVMLTVIVGQFCYTMRTEVNITANFRDEAKGYYLARAGMNLAILKILDQLSGNRLEDVESISGEENPTWRANAYIPPFRLADGRIQIRIDNESGKININEADQHMLAMMLRPFDLPTAQQYTIVSSIMDWRDMDDFLHSYGAENEYYQSLPVPYQCRNGPFKTINELLLVKGVTRELWDKGLKKMVTLHSDLQGKTNIMESDKEKEKGKININAAPPEVLRCFPNMTEDILNAILEYRKEKDFESNNQFRQIVGPDVYPKIFALITLKNSSFYTIRSSGMIDGSHVSPAIEAVIQFDRHKKKFRIIDWLDYAEQSM